MRREHTFAFPHGGGSAVQCRQYCALQRAPRELIRPSPLSPFCLQRGGGGRCGVVVVLVVVVVVVVLVVVVVVVAICLLCFFHQKTLLRAVQGSVARTSVLCENDDTVDRRIRFRIVYVRLRWWRHWFCQDILSS